MKIILFYFFEQRPYRLAVGGEETIVCFYEGPPFKYKFSNKVNIFAFNSRHNFIC